SDRSYFVGPASTEISRKRAPLYARDPIWKLRWVDTCATSSRAFSSMRLTPPP
ncbi:hypothetical protein B296_00048552, partial [Ensete ventricosum]